MKKIILLSIISTTLPLFGQQITPKEAFLAKWENSKNYLLEIVEVMQEEYFMFKPSEREMTFLEQLVHIKGNMDWLSTTYFTTEKFIRSRSEATYSKEAIKDLLRSSFDATAAKVNASTDSSLSDIVDFFSGPKSKLQILNLLQDHVTHHRGQLIVYLNLKGIEPPRYVGW
jgi:uncharacterized damage-inducible protein DinB